MITLPPYFFIMIGLIRKEHYNDFKDMMNFVR